mgnify:FL=1
MRGRKAWIGILILVAVLLLPTAGGAAPAGRSLLILPYQPLDLEREEQWVGDGVAHVLALALANHSAFVLVDPARVRRLAQPETWGDEAVLGAARNVRADLALYGEI